MVERILVSILIPALLLLTFPHSPTELAKPTEPTEPLKALARTALSTALLGSTSVENELFVFTRRAPDQVAPGETFTVTEELRAKVELSFAAIVSELPPGFELVSGDLRAFRLGGLQPGETLTNSYDVRAPQEEGTFTLTANARAKPTDGDSQGLSAELTVTVTPQAQPPQPPEEEPQPPDQPEPENLPPVAVFVYDPIAPKAGEPVTFDATASIDPDGAIVDYRWDLGDGTVLSGPDKAVVTHVYERPGAYNVRLVVVDDQGAASEPQVLTVVVEERPVPTIFGIPQNIAIAVGAVVGAVVLYVIARAILAPKAPEEAAVPAPTALEAALKPQLDAFLSETPWPLTGAEVVEVVETVNPLTRARWVRTLTQRSWIVLAYDEKGLTVKPFGELSDEERARLDVEALGADSLLAYISKRVASGDRVVKLRWTLASGETIESLAVVDAQGNIKYDTLMGPAPLALTPAQAQG